MNQLLVFITVLVAFVYFGGSNVPKVLKDNKQMLLGFVGGVVLYSSMGMRVEGLTDRQKESCSTGDGGADIHMGHMEELRGGGTEATGPLGWWDVHDYEVCNDGLTCQDSGRVVRRGLAAGHPIYRCLEGED